MTGAKPPMIERYGAQIRGRSNARIVHLDIHLAQPKRANLFSWVGGALPRRLSQPARNALGGVLEGQPEADT